MAGVELQSPKHRCCVHDFSCHPQHVRLSSRSITLSTNKAWISLSGFRSLLCNGSSPSKAESSWNGFSDQNTSMLCPDRYIFSLSMDTYEVVLLHRNVGLLFQGRNCLMSMLFVKLLCYYFVCLLKYTFLLKCCFPAPVCVHFVFFSFLSFPAVSSPGLCLCVSFHSGHDFTDCLEVFKSDLIKATLLCVFLLISF